MGNLTKNISRHELVCRCGKDCGYRSMDYETIMIIQECCDHFAVLLGVEKVVLNINSAARCYTHNTNIGSNDNSQHPRCCAMDFSINGIELKDIYKYLDKKYPNQFGIGLYLTFVHFDTRKDKARW